MTTPYKPILCLDFDGVIHSYVSGWKGAATIPDPPVDGAMAFIERAMNHFRVAIFSSRSNQEGGLQAMKDYMLGNMGLYLAATYGQPEAVGAIAMVNDFLEWPTEKPAAFVTIDDRALTFDGTWPDVAALKEFKPWNKR